MHSLYNASSHNRASEPQGVAPDLVHRLRLWIGVPVFFFSIFQLGCATSLKTATGPGFMYTDVTEATSVGSYYINATKTGEACSLNILGLISEGDISIAAAKKKGGIVEVTSVETSTKSFFGIYGSVCTIVHGN
jgi:hypothetical protein